MTPSSPAEIPEEVAERFFKSFDAFVAAVRAAIVAGIPNPAISSTPAFLSWQTQALPRLEDELISIRNAFTLFQIGETVTLSKLARVQLGLAKHLDGFPLDFAGPDRMPLLDQLETAIVTSAYQLCVAAGTL